MLINKEKAKEKLWITKSFSTPESISAVNEISAKLGLNPILASLLYNRGYTDSKACASFLRMENEMLRNPFDLADMEKGVQRIIRAIDHSAG